MEEKKMMEKTYSRKDVLKTAGKATAGIAILSTVPSFLTGCKKSAEIPSKEVLAYEYMEKKEGAVDAPYPYQKLDPATTMERAYAGYFNIGNCCRGAADAIIGQLGDVAGYPWNQIPVNAFANGGTGYGVGSLCGALGGAVLAIGLACTPEDAQKLTGELFKWYTSTDLPIYQPDAKLVLTTSKTVNCLDSVTEFMNESGFAMGDPERKARCAGLTGDVARKTVELLNAHYNL